MHLIYKSYLILLILASFLFGQNLKGLGVKAGLVTSNQNWEYTEQDINIYDENFYGLYLGISYDFMNFTYFSSNFEIAYTQKGMAEEIHTTVVSPDGQGFIDTGKKTFKNRFDNISIAMYGNFKYETDIITPYILFGPRFDIQTSRHIEIGEISNKFEKYILGYSFGVGIAIHGFERHDLILEFTSSPNINNLYKSELFKVSNYSYEIKLGVKIK